MRAARKAIVALAMIVAAVTMSAPPVAATSRPWDGVVYRYIKILPDGRRQQCTVYWNRPEFCRDMDTQLRWAYTWWAGWVLVWP